MKLTFSSALRAILRQDPDVILVGEIRDEETAKIAMQAAQTGHFVVLSTLHTDDAPPHAAPARGFDVGVLAKPRRGLFARPGPALHVLARFVPTVDVAALEETWALASKNGATSGGGPASFSWAAA